MRALRTRVIPLAACVLLLAGGSEEGGAQAVKVDAAVAAYEKTSGISGSLNSIGSDTLNNLMTLWAEGFQKTYPSVRVQIEGKGSSTAPPALISGTARIGPMSRPMKSSEIDAFEERYGYKPTAVRVALDGLAVYVNKDNPIERLTLPQVDAIFSKNRKGGLPKDIAVWGDVDLTGAWKARRISLYGRNSASGTYGYFKKLALFKGDYKDTVKEQPGSASVVQGVAKDVAGIGYSGIGYKTSGVKAVKLAKSEGGEYHGVTYDKVVNGKYPLARFLYLYINRPPNKELDPIIREFLRYTLSREGQQIVVKDGYLPIPARVVEEELSNMTRR